MYEQITIKTLKTQGKKVGEIARIMNCHRNTVLNVLKKEPKEREKRDRPSSFAIYQEQIEEMLDKGLTRLRVWQILNEETQNQLPTYSGILKYLQDHHGRKTPISYVVQTTTPAEEAEVDFGYAGLIPTKTGIYLKTWIFVITLSYSRKSYYEPVHDQSVQTFIACHQHAFSSFSGVPKTIKLDNLKAAIITNRRYDIEFNKDFLSFSSHYKFIIKPCTPREPNQKGKVESQVKFFKRNFLAGRTFSDEIDFRQQLNTWVHQINRRTHGTTKKIPHEVFLNEEQPKLQPLPITPFNLIPTIRRKVKLNCHIQWEENYYSVPAKYVGEFVDVRMRGNLIEIVDWDGNIVATHKQSQIKGEYITNPTHFPEHKIYSEASHQRKYEEKMEEIGPNSHEFFKHLIVRDPTGWRRVVGKILGLVQLYGKEKVEKAVKRALVFNAIKWKAVRNICEQNLQDLEIEPQLVRGQEEHEQLTPQKNPPSHEATGDLDRDLDDYRGRTIN